MVAIEALLFSRLINISAWKVKISKKLKGHSWQVLPKRRIVERTFAWLNHSRRLSKDYELTIASNPKPESKIFLRENFSEILGRKKTHGVEML